jgi:5-methylcytosine-specific restriction endonuclease McrA
MVPNFNLPKTQEEAAKQGSLSYFTGVACKNGHTEQRYTTTGICYECKRQQMQRDYSKHEARVSAANRRSYQNNKKASLAYSKQWAEGNRGRSREIKKAWKMRNKETIAAYWKEFYGNKRKNDPTWRLSKNTSKSIWDSLKKAKGGRHWETLVNFTLEELQAHLEKQFQPNMTWDNYGPYWEVDHIKPLSKCESFEEAWALTNLQPLTCTDNRSKGNR